ncbi:hypothetical protein GOODEAATRI_021395 [Goodea atripinnis]|uniref:Uncharacterized protein n=1 Tax=Goodea atripinnis TaxID=208336 RepID=A0ABV0MUN8_9TELE
MYVEVNDRRLTSTAKKQNAAVIENKLTNSPPWNSPNAKPKDKSFPSGLERQLTLHLDKTAWPPIQRNVSSTLTKRRKQQRTVLTTNDRSKPTEHTGIPLENRITSRLQDSDPQKESSSFTSKRYENRLPYKHFSP